MENSLICQIRNAVVENDTTSLKQLIYSQPKADSIINKDILHCLQSIIIDSSNKHNAVNCVLSCLKFFCEQSLEENVWGSFANEFVQLCVICLKLCVGLNSKFEAEDSLLIYLSEIVTMLAKQSDLIVENLHFLLLQPLIVVVTEEHFSFEAKYSLVKTISCIVKSSDEDNHNRYNPHFHNEIATLSNWIFVCGDYGIQTDILETLLYFLIYSGASNRSDFCKEWFHLYPEIRADFINRDFTDFEPEARMFLNFVNTLNRNPLVFSIGCICAFSDDIRLQKPNDSNYLSFWIDFNICSESILICHQGDEKWETVQFDKKNILEVYSVSGEYNIKGQLAPIVKLCFNLSSVVNVVEIWFEMSDQFLTVEKNFLIPIFGQRYKCNWKMCPTDGTLSNEIVPLRKYAPLSIIINPRKSAVPENPRNSDFIETANEKTFFNSSPHSQSSLINDGGIQTIDSDHNSSDEIESTPKIISTPKKYLTRFQCNSSVRSSGAKSNLSRQGIHVKEVGEANKNIDMEVSQKTLRGMEESLKDITHKEKPEHIESIMRKNKSKHTCNVSSLKNLKDNQVQSKTESTKRKKLFYSPENTEEYNTISPLYDISQPYTEVNPGQNVAPRVSYSYRTYKDRPVQEITQKPDSRKFFKVNSDELTISQDSVFTKNSKSYPTETPVSKKKPLYQYSDFSSSSEKLKSIKKTYKPFNKKYSKKRQRKLKPKLQLASDSDSMSVAKGKAIKKNETRNSYVSRLEKTVDPLRDKEPEPNYEHEVVPEMHVDEVIQEKEIIVGENIFNSFEKAEENFHSIKNDYFEDEFVNNDPKNILRMEDGHANSLQMVKCSRIRQEPELKTFTENKSREKKKCNTKLQECKVVATMPLSPKTSVISNKNNLTKHFLKYESLLLNEFPKMIDEAKTSLKTEIDPIAAHFISKLEFQQNNISSLLLEIDKCKKSLEEINTEIKNISKTFKKSILQLQSKHSRVLEKYLKSFKAEIKKYAQVPEEK